MATVSLLSRLHSTDNTTSYTTPAFTPVAGQFLIVMFSVNNTEDTVATVTASANGLTFTQEIFVDADGGFDASFIFSADQMVPASPSSMTITVSVVDPGVGCNLGVWGVDSATGIQQVAGNAQGAGQTPNCSFATAPDAGNPVITFFTSNTNPPVITAPSGFTSDFSDGYNTPTTGSGGAHVDSGFTNTLVEWTGTGTRGGTLAAEIAAGAPAGGDSTVDVTDSIGLTEITDVNLVITGAPDLVGFTSDFQDATGTSITLDAPAGVAVGDAQFVSITINTENDTIDSVPSGWTLKAQITNPKNLGADVFITYVYESTTDTGTAVWTKTQTTGSSYHAVRIAYTGQSAISAGHIVEYHPAQDTAPLPTETTTVNNSIELAIFTAEKGVNNDIITPPTGFTNLFHEVVTNENLYMVVSDYLSRTPETINGQFTIDSVTYPIVFTVILDGATGPQTHTQDKTDNVDLTETIQKVVSYQRPKTDSVALTETTTRKVTFSRTAQDTVNLTEEATVSLTRFISIEQTDTVAIEDTFTRIATLTRSQVDLIELTDSRIFGREKFRTDPVAVVESKEIQKPQNPLESMAMTDSFLIETVFGKPDTDPVAVSDVVAFDREQTRTDSVEMTDSFSMEKSFSINVTDDTGLTEVFNRVIPSQALFTNLESINEIVSVSLFENTRKPSSRSIVDEARIKVKTALILSDEQVAILTIDDLGHRYWSDLSGLTPEEANSINDHFRRADPTAVRTWLEEIIQ